MHISYLGVFLFSVKPLTTENNENITTPKIRKITVILQEAVATLKVICCCSFQFMSKDLAVN